MGRPYPAFLSLIGLIVPTTFSILLLNVNLRGWHSSERYAQFVTNEKPSIAIGVQILSYSLGLFQIVALCTVISLSFQRHAATKPFSLNSLRLINSIYALRFDFTLPFHLILVLVAFVGFSVVPAALWSGAITPNVVSKNITQPFSVPHIELIDYNNPIAPERLTTRNEPTPVICPWISGAGQDIYNATMGDYHTCYDKLSYLSSASTSSALNAIPGLKSDKERKAHIHTKLDRSGYSFIGRSYGAGGTVGLVPIPVVQFPLSYTFAEVGLQAQVECQYNQSSTFELKFVQSGTQLMEFNSDGRFAMPDGQNSSFTFSQYGRLGQDFFSWGERFSNRTQYLALAAVPVTVKQNTCSPKDNPPQCGYGYAILDKISCRMNFTANSMKVGVDAVARTISVEPKHEAEWPSYADDMLYEVSREMGWISANDGTFGGSGLGSAIKSNIKILASNLNQTYGSDNSTTLRAVESFVADMFDNSLQAFYLTYYYRPKDRKGVVAEVSRAVVVYGEARFIYAAVVLNLVVLIVFAWEAIRTNFWKDIANIDLLDIVSVSTATSYGGNKLASHVSSLGVKRSVSVSAGTVKVRLRKINKTMSAIEPVGGLGSGLSDEALLMPWGQTQDSSLMKPRMPYGQELRRD
ncbi:hypothetical protein P154DRAFT_561474 [Amniculicola lignicola CBS 123094]|uniref:Uncharacterized protein n=1 Tax=Amniculicola lignicola CBS 123094 TaxID=1392246 RepID=A0A6A5WV72_9PLEO|nr:hypothetical protein P154DRAFT_561474 [Amniculicola lignicola CBS 123094]